MAVINLKVYKVADNRENLLVTKLEPALDPDTGMPVFNPTTGRVALTVREFIDVQNASKVELTLIDTSGQELVLTSIANPAVFERYVKGRLDLRLGPVAALTPGTVWAGRLKVFDDATNQNGVVILDFEEDIENEMDALKVQVF